MKTPYEYKKAYKENNPEGYRYHKKKYETLYHKRVKFTKKVWSLKNRGYLVMQPCILCGSTDHIQACTLSPSPSSPWWLCHEHNRWLHLMKRSGFNPKEVLGV